MIHLTRDFYYCIMVFLLFTAVSFAFPQSSSTAAEKEKQNAWTVIYTVNAALRYNPSLKQEQESRRVAEENVRQAKAGHLPRLDVYGGTGGRTVLVPKR